VVKKECENSPLKASVSDENITSFIVKVESPMWLENYYVGRLSKACNLQAVNESFFLGGFSFVRVISLGDLYVLLSSETTGSLEKLIEENK